MYTSQNILIYYAAVMQHPILVANYHPQETNTHVIPIPSVVNDPAVPHMTIMHHWFNQEAEIGHSEALVSLLTIYYISIYYTVYMILYITALYIIYVI